MAKILKDDIVINDDNFIIKCIIKCDNTISFNVLKDCSLTSYFIALADIYKFIIEGFNDSDKYFIENNNLTKLDNVNNVKEEFSANILKQDTIYNPNFNNVNSINNVIDKTRANILKSDTIYNPNLNNHFTIQDLKNSDIVNDESFDENIELVKPLNNNDSNANLIDNKKDTNQSSELVSVVLKNGLSAMIPKSVLNEKTIKHKPKIKPKFMMKNLDGTYKNVSEGKRAI